MIRNYVDRFSLDFETRSGSDIMKEGRHKYVAHPDFKILMMSFTWNNEKTQLYECYDRQLPKWFIKDVLPDPEILKTAYEAPFEINCIEAEVGIAVDRSQWQCTKVMAGMAGYPMNLKDCANAMKIPQLKDVRGKRLIKLFCQPAKPTKRNGFKEWNLPEYFPNEWQEFCEYCIQDNVVEVAILDNPTVADMPDMPAFERDFWLLDQKINDRGVMVDVELMEAITDMHNQHVRKLVHEGTNITGLQNVNSDAQLQDWLNSQGCIMANMQKDTVFEKLGHPNLAGKVKRVLQIRTEMAKTSMKKYDSVKRTLGRLSRLRGMFQFYGANRTGRHAGRIVNLQNLPKNKQKKARLALARALALKRSAEVLKLLFGSLPQILSELIRTLFIPTPGRKLIVSDFASIESRVGGWLAEAKWKLDAFRAGKDAYLVLASFMYDLPYEELDWPEEKGKHPLRESAKVGELLGQYGGGENAMITGGALKSGKLKQKDLPRIKKAYRKSNPETVQLWEDLETAAKDAINDPGLITQIPSGKIKYMMQHGNLLCKLPSGRTLSYVNAEIKEVNRENPKYDLSKLLDWIEEELGIPVKEVVDDEHDYNVKALVKYVETTYKEEVPWFVVNKFTSKWFKGEAIVYEGMQEKGKGQRVWGIASTWGGKLMENVVQAISRDILAEAMLNLDYYGHDIVIHVYDEVVCDSHMEVTVDEINKIMEIEVPWAPDIPIKAAGFETMFYLKD